MSISIVNALPEAEWRQFVERHPQGNIFHTPEMIEVFSRVPGHKPAVWAVVADDGRPLALLPHVKIALMNGPLRRFTTRTVGYGSVLAAPGAQGREALACLLRAYNHETAGSVLFTELRNLSNLDDLQPVLVGHGFRFEEHLNYLIDLNRPEDVVYRGITKSGRQTIRTSLNKGTQIEEVTDRQAVGVAYRLLEKVYSRARVPLASRALFEAAFDVLAARGMLKIFLARAGPHPIGACLVLAYKDRLIDWYAGTDRAFAAYGPMELLIWHAIRWGQANGFCVFDFGGAGRPNEDYGPRKFKAKFGGWSATGATCPCLPRCACG
jgi:hypothetical protein